MAEETVTATVIEMGDVKIERIGTGEIDTIERGVVIQFDSVEDLKLAIAANRRVRLEWKC